MKALHREFDETYGSPRMHRELQERGLRCGRHRVARLMRKNGIVAVHKRAFRVTTDSAHPLPVAANVLERKFKATAPDQKWVGDITYIPTREGWLYLAVVMDLFSRRIIGWSMNERLEKELATDALKMALKQRGIAPELFHSDRGVQYASGAHQELLEQNGVIASMSRKANCWDNAVAESFFRSLKVERVYRRRYASRQHARIDIFDYIERFYNRKRRHSSLGYLCPAAFEESRIAA
jgi:putative transposase